MIDGDTFDLMVDLGFRSYSKVRVRLHGLDAPEQSTPEGKAVTVAVASWLSQPLIVQSYKNRRTFERWECEVWSSSGELLADWMTARGYIKSPSQLMTTLTVS